MEKKDFEVCWHCIQEYLKDNTALLTFIDLALVTERLISPDKLPSWVGHWIRKNINIQALFTGKAFDRLPSCFCVEELFSSQDRQWCKIDVPLVKESGGFDSFCVFAGTFLPDCFLKEHNINPRDKLILPVWAESVMGEETRQTAAAAAMAALNYSHGKKGAFFIYPLTFSENRVQIFGRSLGLPLALLFLSMVENSGLSNLVTASGGIDTAGDVFKVGSIEIKFRAAQKRNYNLFISPSLVSSSNISPSSTESVSVSNLNEAWLFATFCRPGNSFSVTTIWSMMRSGKALASNIEDCNFKLLIPAICRNMMDTSINQLKSDKEAFSRFAEIVSSSSFLSRSNTEKQCVASLFSYRELRENKNLPDNALAQYIVFALHTANNIGDVQKGADAVKNGEHLIQESGLVTLENCTDFFNNRAVFFHNRYDFKPDGRALKVARYLEAHHNQASEIGITINPLFGRLCGTISQSFGFSGPGHIEAFEMWNKKACRCFGKSAGNRSEFKNERLRQYNYAVYAYLDAGFYEKALSVLLSYLEVDSIAAVKGACSKFSPWHHAALARFFADVNPVLPEAVEYAVQLYTDGVYNIQPSHPWQLWCCNTAKIALAAGEITIGETLLKKSLEICLSEKTGETVTMMALLPLYEMWSNRSPAFTSLTSTVERTIIKKGPALNPYHFARLKRADSLIALFQNSDFSIKQMFPFSYR